MSIIDERLVTFVHEAIPYRELTVSISRADERRLARYIASLNHGSPEDPLNPHSTADLALAFTCCALTGLAASEDEDGVWAGTDGRCWDLPRRVRAPWHLRLKFAWRSARQTWRAT